MSFSLNVFSRSITEGTLRDINICIYMFCFYISKELCNYKILMLCGVGFVLVWLDHEICRQHIDDVNFRTFVKPSHHFPGGP